MNQTDTANTERAQAILDLAQAIAKTSDDETQRALAAMLTATAEELIMSIAESNLA